MLLCVTLSYKKSNKIDDLPLKSFDIFVRVTEVREGICLEKQEFCTSFNERSTCRVHQRSRLLHGKDGRKEKASGLDGKEWVWANRQELNLI